ncbi:MAG: TonB-dependent receptor [Bacteroidales bacterium]|nr:TonB-dependent receptor [Bacteroidales bacterium]
MPGKALWGQAQGSVTGQVTDAGSGDPLIAVHVSTDRHTGTTTDLNGAFSLSLDAGEHLVEFSYMGYSDLRKEIILREGEILHLEIGMSRSSKMLDEVVVSAGKYEQKLSEVTVSLEVIKPHQLSNQNISSLDMILEKTPGISILDGQPSIRGGSGFSYGVGSRVLMLVDDLPMISADAGDIKWNYMPVENLGQVEVIKGASSVLYGSSALNGVINLKTRSPDLDPRTEATLFGGAYLNPARKELIWWDRRPLFAGASFSHLRKIGKFDLSLGGNYFKDEGYREGDYESRIRGNLGLKYRSAKIQGLTLGLAASGMVADQSDFLLWQDAGSGAYLQNPESMTPLKGNRYNIDPSVEYLTGRGNKHSLKTRLYSVGNVTINDERSSASKLWYLEYRYLKRFRKRTHWTSGISFSRNTVLAGLYDNHKGSNSAIFSQLDAHLFKKLQVSTGLRWELNSLNGELFYSLPVLRAGLSYQAGEGTFIRSSIGQGYRFPSVAEKFADANIGGLKIFRNPELDPERGWSSEVGVKQEIALGRWLGLADLALFWTEYNNMIEYTFGVYPPTPDDVPTIDDVGFKALNTGTARINGLDGKISMMGMMGPLGLRFSGGYTWMNPVDPSLLDSVQLVNEEGHILKYRRRHLLKMDLELEAWKIFAGINLQYNSRMINVDIAFIDPGIGNLILPGFPNYWEEHATGYTVLDLRIGWSITEMIRMTAILRNALNVEYLGRPGDIGPPRNITLQLRFNL